MGIGEAGLLISTNNIVTELQDVFDNPVTFGDAGTLSGRRESLTHYANSIWHDAAVRSKNCTKDYETDLGVFQASEKDLRARTGVNISEEIVLLLESQKIFAASAKCLQIFDKCLEKLMSI
jgi:flagellar hook-associated protein FlgK